MFRYRRAAHVVCALSLRGLVFGVSPVDAQQAAPASPAEHVHPATPSEGAAQAPAHQHETMAASVFAPRETSGTGWQPDTTPMHGWHRQSRGWEVMVHGNAFVHWLHEDAPEHRGATQGGSINCHFI